MKTVREKSVDLFIRILDSEHFSSVTHSHAAYFGRVVSENESEIQLCPGGICYVDMSMKCTNTPHVSTNNRKSI